jgi:tRNA(Ile)-lysidine synthase
VKDSQTILESVKKTIDKYNLHENGEKILVAYSGGVDSSALLSVLLELRRCFNFEISLGHFNHHLRPNSNKDEEFVRRVARKHSLPLFVGSEDVRSHAKLKRLNLEEAGRMRRYAFLTHATRKIGDAKIATGHTMDDQAETFFMRLLRGSGLRGLGSISPIIEGKIVRPLLFVQRKDIEDYIRERGLEFRVDESNRDRRFARNRVRLELIPYIQERYDPNIVPRISKVVSILQEDENILERLGRREAEKRIVQRNGRSCLNVKNKSALPLGLARRVVRDFIAEVKGDLRGISFEEIEGIMNLEEGKSFHLKRDLVLRREEDRICPRQNHLLKMEYAYRWGGKKALEIKELVLTVKAKRMKHDSSSFVFDDETRVYVDGKKIVFPLLIRNRHEGDRYQPLGTPGRKKLKEIMRAKGVPLEDREKRPLFISGEDIVWIPGLPVAEQFKIDPKSEEIVEISVSRTRKKPG